MKNLAHFLERINLWVGGAVRWLCIVMVINTFITVLLRHFFDTGSIKLQESVIYLHGIVFMLGAAYTYAQNEHVRVDIFYQKMSPTKQLVVDVLGNIFLLMPLCVFIFWMSLNYVEASWNIQEKSSEAGGLAWVYWLKSLLLLMPALLMIQAISNSLLNISKLLSRSHEYQAHKDGVL